MPAKEGGGGGGGGDQNYDSSFLKTAQLACAPGAAS
jgi:hypothetical protein